MWSHDATEVAYKNGYAAGQARAAEELKNWIDAMNLLIAQEIAHTNNLLELQGYRGALGAYGVLKKRAQEFLDRLKKEEDKQ